MHKMVVPLWYFARHIYTSNNILSNDSLLSVYAVDQINIIFMCVVNAFDERIRLMFGPINLLMIDYIHVVDMRARLFAVEKM